MATKIRIPGLVDTLASGVNAFDDLASTIASPPLDRPIKGTIGLAGQQFCNYLGAVPGVASGLLGPGFTTAALLCQPYWDDQGYDEPIVTPSFGGGQCSGTGYQASYQLRQRSSSTFGCGEWSDWEDRTGTIGAFPIPGPITGIEVVDEVSGIPTSPRRRGYLIKGNGGDAFLNLYGNTVATYNPGCEPAVEYRALSFSRVSGGPDVCGDPPGGTFSPGGSPPPTPTFPPGQEPGVDPDGQPFFFVPPIDGIDGEPIEVPPPGGGGGPTQPPTAGEEEDGGTGDEEFPPPEPGRRWVGCCIRLTAIPVGTGTIPGTAPEPILTEVVGNARLLFDSATGDGYDTPVQIRSGGLCLWEPVKGLSPKGVRVNLRPGFEYVYRPYSVLEEE
jgi:hypothetical protein